MRVVKLDGESLTISKVVDVARKNQKVGIDKRALAKLEKCRRLVEKFVEEEKIIYGITTGFGAFKNKVIPKKDVETLQENLILSHATGVGKPLPEDVVRAMLLIRSNTLMKGNSGVRKEIVQTLVEMLNKSIHSVIPEKGSVGSSGDLAPMAHLVLVMIGKGEAFYKGRRVSGAKAMKLAGVKPVKLTAKEGLALINGATAMTAIGALAVNDALKLCDIADENGALAIEGLRGTTSAFQPEIHKVRPYPGQIQVAKKILSLLKGSTMVDPKKIQDQYSLRCIPQVHGAVRDSIVHVKKIIETELNSATDNPLIFPDSKNNQVLSGGNFHGEPIAIAMDFLGIAVSELGNIADRRLAAMLDPSQNNGLPAFLIKSGGLNSGFMLTQYTTAALVSENKVLAHPASVDSIPTSANSEDHVSMGTIAARKAAEIIENTKNVLAIERLGACQAIDFRLKEGLKLASETKTLFKKIRKSVPYLKSDSTMYPLIIKAKESIWSD